MCLTAQSVGMGVALCGDFPSAKTLYDKASDILGYDLLEQVIAILCQMLAVNSFIHQDF